METGLLGSRWEAAAASLPSLASGRLEVEIGCGNGHFLCEYAADRPETTLVGIDIKKKRCFKARQKAERRGYRNVLIVNTSAEMMLRELNADSVDAFHIYFPDPWPKSRHRKRRFFTMENLRRMHELLRPGGRIHFGTDFFDYYVQAKVLTALHPGFCLSEEPAPALILSSLYGRKFSGASKSIHLFSAVKTTSADEERQQHEHERDVDRGIQDDEHG